MHSSSREAVGDANVPSLSEVYAELTKAADECDGDFEPFRNGIGETTDRLTEINNARKKIYTTALERYIHAEEKRQKAEAEASAEGAKRDTLKEEYQRLEQEAQELQDKQYDLQVRLEKCTLQGEQYRDTVAQLSRQFAALKVREEEQVNMYRYIRKLLVLISSIKLHTGAGGAKGRNNVDDGNIIKGFISKSVEVDGDTEVIPFSCDLSTDSAVYVNEVWAKIIGNKSPNSPPGSSSQNIQVLGSF